MRQSHYYRHTKAVAGLPLRPSWWLPSGQAARYLQQNRWRTVESLGERLYAELQLQPAHHDCRSFRGWSLCCCGPSIEPYATKWWSSRAPLRRHHRLSRCGVSGIAALFRALAIFTIGFQPAVLISRSFDGELIARTIERLGFLTARGSSTRSGGSGLWALAKAVERGHRRCSRQTVRAARCTRSSPAR